MRAGWLAVLPGRGACAGRPPPRFCKASKPSRTGTVAVGASMAQQRSEGEAAGDQDAEEALFAAARAQSEAMIAWARGEEALGAEHGELEERVMADGMELMRLLAQAHLDLRAAREQRRDDVTGADGGRRVTCEAGHERTRLMIFGSVRTSRIAYRRRGKENLYPQDADLNWGQHAYSAGIVSRNARAVAAVPFGPAAAQVSAQGAIRLGKRQCEELAIAAACDFEAYYASRRPEPSPAGTGLLITADGSAFPSCPARCARLPPRRPLPAPGRRRSRSWTATATRSRSSNSSPPNPRSRCPSSST